MPIYDRIDKLSKYVSHIFELRTSVKNEIDNIIEKGELVFYKDKKKKIKNIISEIKNDILLN